MTMTTLPEIAPGRLILLWRTGSHDGMVSGVGMLEGKPVHLDASNNRGGWELKPEWAQLRDQLDHLLKGDDSENIWDRIERAYEKEMNEDLPRIFTVSALDEAHLGEMREQHRKWQLHVGLTSDFFYDDQGRPRSYPLERLDECSWKTSREYVQAHYWDVTPLRGRYPEGLEPLGKILSKDLYVPTDHRIPWPKDPRSEDLKRYQASWKPGDPVRLDC
jgi:hypothetical protein